MDITDFINESRAESGRGSKEGRFKGVESSKGRHKGKVSAEKSKAKVYSSIMDALKHGKVGEVFSTTESDRLYVITAGGWGKDKEQRVGNKTAKGFTPGAKNLTTGADFNSVKKFAKRTLVRHGHDRSKALTTKGAAFKNKFRGRFGRN